MKSALTGLIALAALLVSPSAKAAQQVLCNSEGSTFAITVEGDASAFRYQRYYGGGGYYDIEATRSGVWLLLDEPRRVISIQLIGPDDPIDLVLTPYFQGGRCWR